MFRIGSLQRPCFSSLGQTKPVQVDRITILNSVEQRIAEMQDRKKGLADSSLGEESAFINISSSFDANTVFTNRETERVSWPEARPPPPKKRRRNLISFPFSAEIGKLSVAELANLFGLRAKFVGSLLFGPFERFR